MSRLRKAIFLGFLIGILGVGIGFFHFAHNIEDSVGLGLLFKLRGERQAPSDVVVVSIDEESSENLSLPDNPIKWPRSFHARLIENLSREGAKVIAFDVHFIEPTSYEDDNLFAEAIRESGNVVLCESLKAKDVSAPDPNNGGYYNGIHSIVKIVKPIPLFSKFAMATAPFPLPRMPFRVNRFWTFQPGAGDLPTLPVVTFQFFALQVYEEFIHLLNKISPNQAKRLPLNCDTIIEKKGIKNLIRDIREIFETEPLIGERMLEELRHSKLISVDLQKYKILKSLIEMYRGENSRYINFYGPPRTITTLSYYQALQLLSGVVGDKQIDIRGKAIFVGSSAILLTERKDIFSTIFSGPKGIFISGVEIAATAFLNILENTAIKPVSLYLYILIILLWGILMGIFCRISPIIVASLGVIAFSLLYLMFAGYQFKINHSFYPIAIPLFFQTPCAFFSSVLLNYFDTSKERQNIRDAFGYYLPKEIVDKVAKNISIIKTYGKVVYGIFLNSDIENYTSLSETMDPKQLASFMNRYYEKIFKPTKQYGGIVSDIIGDSMMALWMGSPQETLTREKACLAALDIQKAVQQFNLSSDNRDINIRIGIHYGPILMGHIGAIDHYEYRPVGDIVNTASRIEGLNKYLGTSVLVSEEVMHQLDGFLTREIGKFKLKGKKKLIVIHELLCRLNESEEKQRKVCTIFADALYAFRRQSWDEAIEKFHQSILNYKKNSPSQFYIKLCEGYKKNPPKDPWEGVVNMEKK